MILEVPSYLVFYDSMVFCDTPMKKTWSQDKSVVRNGYMTTCYMQVVEVEFYLH